MCQRCCVDRSFSDGPDLKVWTAGERGLLLSALSAVLAEPTVFRRVERTGANMDRPARLLARRQDPSLVDGSNYIVAG